jgi:hypothetical protein
MGGGGFVRRVFHCDRVGLLQDVEFSVCAGRDISIDLVSREAVLSQ